MSLANQRRFPELSRSSKRSGMLYALIGMLALALLPLAAPIGGTFFCVATATLAFSLFSYVLLQSTALPLYTLNIVVISQIVQTACLFSFAVLGVPPIVASNESVQDISQVSAEAIFPYLIPCGAALVVSLLARLLRANPKWYERDFWRQDPIGSQYICIAGVVLLFALPLTAILPATIAYFFRIADYSTMFLAYYAGRIAVRTPKVRILWIVMLGINGAIFSLTGGRFVAFFPPLLFLLGYLSSAPVHQKRVIRLMLFVMFPAGLFVIGILGVVRREVGRDDWSLVSSEQASRIISTSTAIIAEHPQEAKDDIFLNSIGRIIAWTNPVVCSSTPTIIPYRGYSGLGNEIRAYTHLYFFGNDFGKFESADLGTYPARAYGFSVSDETSVEFGILADGWSRGGLTGALLFSLIFCALAAGLELIVLRLGYFTAAGRMLLLVVCMSNAYQYNIFPLVHVVRFFILSLAFWIVLLIVFTPYLIVLGGKATGRTAKLPIRVDRPNSRRT